MHRGPHAVADGLPPADASDVAAALRHPHSVAERPGAAAVHYLAACFRDEFGGGKRAARHKRPAHDQPDAPPELAAHGYPDACPGLAAHDKVGARFRPGIPYRDSDGHRSGSHPQGDAPHVSPGDSRHAHGRS